MDELYNLMSNKVHLEETVNLMWAEAIKMKLYFMCICIKYDNNYMKRILFCLFLYFNSIDKLGDVIVA